MNRKQITILIGIIFILSIVFFILQNKKESEVIVKKNVPSIKKTEELNIPLKSKEEIKKELAQKEIEYAENIKKENGYFNDAIANGDPKTCENITEEKLKQDCLDNVYLGLSKEKNEISYCMKIKSEEKITNCKNLMYYDLAIKNNSQAFCNKIKSDDTLVKNCNTNIVFTMIETKDLQGNTKICESLIGSDKEYCINRISKADDLEALRDAVEGNNSGDCSNITDINLKNSCLDVITIDKAMNDKNIALCDKIIAVDKKTQCKMALGKILGQELLNEAIEKNDITICNTITDSQLKISCSDTIYTKKAYSEKNILLCDKIQTEKNKTQCKTDLELILKQK